MKVYNLYRYDQLIYTGTSREIMAMLNISRQHLYNSIYRGNRVHRMYTITRKEEA